MPAPLLTALPLLRKVRLDAVDEIDEIAESARRAKMLQRVELLKSLGEVEIAAAVDALEEPS